MFTCLTNASLSLQETTNFFSLKLTIYRSHGVDGIFCPFRNSSSQTKATGVSKRLPALESSSYDGLVVPRQSRQKGGYSGRNGEDELFAPAVADLFVGMLKARIPWALLNERAC